MNFLNSAILFGLAATALPLLIHLFTRSKSKTIPFSTLQFLKELQQQKIRNIKLRQILLLVLRTLIVLLLVLAFARPTLRSTLGNDSSAKTSAVIVLDNSYSMSAVHEGQMLYQTAQQEAMELAKAMRPGDEVYFLTATDTSKQSSQRAFHDFSALRQQIERTNLDYHTTNLIAALECAHTRLRGSFNINKEIYLVSDLQAIAFGQDSLISSGEQVRAFALPVFASRVANLSIEQIKFATSILERGKIAEVQAVINNRGNQPARNKLAQLFLNNARVAQTAVDLEAGASVSVSFKFMLEKSGFMSGYVLLEDDDIVDDNRRYFSFIVPEQMKIAMVGLEPSDTSYPELALGMGSTGQTNYQIEKISIEKLHYAALESFDAVVLSNVPAFDTVVAEKLLNYVQAGGGIMLALGKDVDLRAYNESVNRQLGLPKFLEVIGSMNENGPSFGLGKIDLAHPIFAGIFESAQGNFASPQFRLAIKTQDNSDIDKIIEYIDGSPFLFEAKRGQGVVLVFTTGFAAQLSDLAHRTIFAPLISRSIGYLATQSKNIVEEHLIGQEVRFRLPADELGKSLEMTRPDEKPDRLQPEVTSSGSWVYYTNTDVAGVYKLLADGQLVAQWAVNVDAKESDLTMLKESELKEKYSLSLLERTGNLQNMIYSQRFGKELWKYFAIAALILLIVEMLMYREKGEEQVAAYPSRAR